MTIAVFDLCGTLYASNTTLDFLDFHFHGNPHYQRERRMMNSLFPRMVNSLIRRCTKQELIRARLIGFLRGEPRKSLLQSAETFFLTGLSSKKIRETHDLLAYFRKEHFQLILMSASLDFIVETISKELRCSHFHATTLGYSNETCTGKITNDIMYQKGRIFRSVYGTKGKPIVITNDRYDSDLVRCASKAFIVSKTSDRKYWTSRFSNTTLLDVKPVDHTA